MFVGIRTLDLNFNSAHLRALRYVEQSIASKLERIDRVRDHHSAEAEIILGDRVAYAIARVADGFRVKRGIPKGLFNRVDAQIYSTQLASQLLGNHRLSGARQAAQDNQD